MIIYYILILNNHRYVRWSRPLRVLFPFALQAGQHVRNSFNDCWIIFFSIDSSCYSKYSSNITKYSQCNVSIFTFGINIYFTWCWNFKK
jgi:hypothetical protein